MKARLQPEFILQNEGEERRKLYLVSETENGKNNDEAEKTYPSPCKESELKSILQSQKWGDNNEKVKRKWFQCKVYHEAL